MQGPDDPKPSFEMIERVDVFTTGRRIDAEMVRGLLEAHGFDARIWGSGMGAYRLESAVTEITGVPSPFNAYGVGVPADQAEDARELLADVAETTDAETTDAETVEDESAPGVLEMMRSRWALVAAALFLLVFVILYGPARP